MLGRWPGGAHPNCGEQVPSVARSSGECSLSSLLSGGLPYTNRGLVRSTAHRTGFWQGLAFESSAGRPRRASTRHGATQAMTRTHHQNTPCRADHHSTCMSRRCQGCGPPWMGIHIVSPEDGDYLLGCQKYVIAMDSGKLHSQVAVILKLHCLYKPH